MSALITDILTSPAQYHKVLKGLLECSESERNSYLRNLCLTDLYFLLRYGCGRADTENKWYFDRCREVQAEPNGHLDLWAREHGKAIDVDEPIATPHGWRKHGDIQPCDEVYGPDGKPTQVVARTEVFTDADCYRVEFCDGYSVVASGGHLWTVGLPDMSCIDGTNRRRKWKSATITTRDLADHVNLAQKFENRRYPVIPVALRPPFRLTRKVANCSSFGNKAVRKVKRVDRVPSRPVSCIQVARDDGLYLIGRNLVTTHNSSIITFALTIQNILNDPEITVGIFSHTRPIAKGFLRQIKREFEMNAQLKSLFPDILWEEPARESPKWSEDDGIIVKRQGNPKEATVEGWGLVDGQPTGKHFYLRVYDDVVTRESVTTPEMMKKTTEAWELSDNLGTAGGAVRLVGTRYHFSDTYGELLTRGIVAPRVYPCTRDGTENFEDSNCVLMSPEMLAQKRRTQGPYTFYAQMLLNPKGDETQGFKREWIQTIKGEPHARGLNVYILVDPANQKKKNSDWTTMGAIGLGGDGNYRLLDLVRDRLNLSERANMLFMLHEKWQPIGVGYEQYGLQADIAHIEHLQNERNYNFRITPLGGSMSKVDRIRRLIPVFEQGRFYIPHTIFRTIYDKTTVNLINVFIEEEFLAFPVSKHDDILDMLARILDEQMNAAWPLSDEARTVNKPVPRIKLGYANVKRRR